MKMDAAIEKKDEKWREAVPHHTGPTSKWTGKDDPAAVAQLKLFVEAALHLIDKVEKGIGTQLSEMVHSIRVRTASKLIAWGPSRVARICLAIPSFNCGGAWKLWAYDKLKAVCNWLELSVRCRTRLKTIFVNGATRSAQRGTPEAQNKANVTRRACKSSVSHLPPRRTQLGRIHAGRLKCYQNRPHTHGWRLSSGEPPSVRDPDDPKCAVIHEERRAQTRRRRPAIKFMILPHRLRHRTDADTTDCDIETSITSTFLVLQSHRSD
jgi:hypothetical protein